VTISFRLIIDFMSVFYDLTTAATATLTPRRLAVQDDKGSKQRMIAGPVLTKARDGSSQRVV
jgi:hypothetical protein